MELQDIQPIGNGSFRQPKAGLAHSDCILGPNTFRSITSDYLSKGGGEFHRYDDGILRDMVRDNGEARGLMLRKAICKSALWVSIIGAGALFITAAAVPGVEYALLDNEEEPRESGGSL
jgi:hypothetical protein